MSQPRGIKRQTPAAFIVPTGNLYSFEGLEWYNAAIAQGFACVFHSYRLVYSCSCSWWWIVRQQAEIVTANLQNINSSVNLAEACASHFPAGDMTQSANNPSTSCGYTSADRPSLSASWEDSKVSAEFKVQFRIRHVRIVLDAVYSHASTATHRGFRCS